MNNFRIMHTQITPEIRVSTAAIRYEIYNSYGLRPYFQYETFIFHEDDSRTIQRIHGTSSDVSHELILKSIKAHKHISNNLKNIYQ